MRHRSKCHQFTKPRGLCLCPQSVAQIDSDTPRHPQTLQTLKQVPEVDGIVERLIGFLDVGKDHITAETLIQLCDLLRRFPEAADVALASVAGISPRVSMCRVCGVCLLPGGHGRCKPAV